VLYISSHQFPYYPGTGALEETGVGKGQGFTVNFPLKAGTGDEAFTRIYQDLVPAILEQYRPDWLFISAGYDAHRDDPLAQLEISEQGFARVVQSLQRCGQFCKGRVVYVLEGGYNLEALAASVRTSLEVILGKLSPSDEPLPEPEGWKQYLAAVRRAHGTWGL
jgi:acetoin utilization deacetylase AcuC-like enzyme